MIIRRRALRLLAIAVLASFCLQGATAHGQEPDDREPNNQEPDGREHHVTTLYGHSFPSSFEIATVWMKFQREKYPVALAQKLLEKAAGAQHTMRMGEATHASSWVGINLWLKKHGDTLAALRTAQDAAAPTALYLAERSDDHDRLRKAYRTYPWADPVHKSQLDTADQLLRSGKPHLALRDYEDVLERSEDAALLNRAQPGRWLAAAHLADSPDDIAAMFRDIDPDAIYPWFGEQVPAKEIQAKLTAGMKPAKPYSDLKSLSVRTIQLPDNPPWMGLPQRIEGSARAFLFRHKVQPVVTDQGTVVAGPCLLAWYAGGALDAPTWSNIATMDISHGSTGCNPPRPPFGPVVADGRIYIRCGTDIAPSDQKRTRTIQMRHEAPIHMGFMHQLAAFDQHSGQKLWTTADDPACAKVFAVNAPVYSDGRLYLLSMLKGFVVPGGGQRSPDSKKPTFLVILDAATGRLLHQQELVSFPNRYQPYKPPGHVQPPRTTRKLNLSAAPSQRGWGSANELSHYGNRLTIRDGAVYCLTAHGAAARCDARDGMVEWVTTYPQRTANWHDPAAICRRQGIAPLVGDDVVVLSPRDTVAVIAVDRETGEQLWEKTQIEEEASQKQEPAEIDGPADAHRYDGSLEALGLIGDSVLVAFDCQIAAIELATGKARWTQTLDIPPERPIKVVGNTLYLATSMDLLQIDGATGEIVATRSLTPLRTDAGFAFDEKGLIIVKPGKYGITSVGTPGEEPQR